MCFVQWLAFAGTNMAAAVAFCYVSDLVLDKVVSYASSILHLQSPNEPDINVLLLMTDCGGSALEVGEHLLRGTSVKITTEAQM